MSDSGVGIANHEANDNDSDKSNDASNKKLNHEWTKKGFAVRSIFAFNGDLIKIRLIVHEIILFELLGDSAAPEFKEISNLIK